MNPDFSKASERLIANDGRRPKLKLGQNKNPSKPQKKLVQKIPPT